MTKPTFNIVAALAAGIASSLACAAPALKHEAVNAAGKTPKVGKAASGPATLRAQILLARAHFSTGEMDASYGSNMQRAIAAFQRTNGLKESGTVDKATWEALNRDSAPALVSYAIQAKDVEGPFEPVPEEMQDKAKLKKLGYATIEEALAERFHISPALLKRLNPDKDFSKSGEEIMVPNVLDTEPLPKAGRIVVDKSDHVLMLFDTDGMQIAQFPASTGSDKDPLPIGTWKVKLISENPEFHYNPKLFWDAKATDEKARIAPGPNNPVGVAWIDISKQHYGIHGTPEPSSIGKSQSHGCIRLTNWDVAALIKSVPVGTEILLQE
jgi:lipoprotein-anchoring transpeptidase ErfK/SrfK